MEGKITPTCLINSTSSYFLSSSYTENKKINITILLQSCTSYISIIMVILNLFILVILVVVVLFLLVVLIVVVLV